MWPLITRGAEAAPEVARWLGDTPHKAVADVLGTRSWAGKTPWRRALSRLEGTAEGCTTGRTLAIAAKFSGDEKMLGVFAEGLNVHETTARNLAGREEVTYEERKIAKGIVFGNMYGRASRACAAR